MPSIWDAIVVGAGPAGCLVAERLVARGHSVLLLDGGPRPHPGQKVSEVDRRLWAFTTRGGAFDWYRVRAVGGRTLLWGGWFYRMPEAALRRGGWPYAARTLAPIYRELERKLGVVDGMVDDRYARMARRLGVRILPKRAPLVGDRAWTALDLPIAKKARTHVVALRLEHSRHAATTLTCHDLRDDRVKQLRARAFVLAASPIETARILLESELGRGGASIGKNLVDHIVASYVLIEPKPAPSPAGRGRFPGSALVESFVHAEATSAPTYPGGFSIELSGPFPLASLGVERMVASDDVERSSATLIHALGESFPTPKRFVDLDDTTRDVLGRRVPRIHVAWSAADRRMTRDMERACANLADALAVPGSRLIPLVRAPSAGAGHEAGTCVMGRDDDAPCDPWGKLRLLNNVWIADASVLPTASDRHPTATVLAHALRAADAVASRL